MLGLAKRVRARILLTSTSEVYGNPLLHPQPESYWGNVNPIGLRSCYDEGKRVAETLMMDYHRQHSIEIKIVRIFNTYGSRMALNDGRVMSNFIVQALQDESLTVYGDGGQTRSFCYVDDLVKGLIKMMEQEEFVGPVNIGNPEEVKIIDLAKLILEFTGSTSRISLKSLPADDPIRRCPDITLAREKLGWSPATPLIKGLKKTFPYFKEKLKKLRK
ncbi:MAG: dTDP-4-oxo-6-deoxy-D-allose reductase [Syntrophomonadaceae bacterium]|nr:dTDP-4-oxo-6-deoxy-D-allose reductase [Bacillota bacterium]